MVYPVESNRGTVAYHLTIDPYRQVICSTVKVPPYPEIDEVVKIATRERSQEVMVITAVDSDGKSVQGYFLRKVGGRHPRWTVNRSSLCVVPLINVLCIVPSTFSGGCFYLEM